MSVAKSMRIPEKMFVVVGHIDAYDALVAALREKKDDK